MNRHTRTTDRIKEKNDKLHFTTEASPKTKALCKEYKKLYEMNIQKQLGKIKGYDAFDFIVKISQFKSKAKENPQTKNISFNMSTYGEFSVLQDTPLNAFLIDKHIPLF